MAIYKIKDFAEIDFLMVDATSDIFILPGGESYRFSEHMCDACWTGGTILESSENKEKKLYCVLCNEYLKKYSFKNDFLEPTGDILEFYLPERWSTETLETWYDSFKQRRLEQEKVRERILREGKE